MNVNQLTKLVSVSSPLLLPQSYFHQRRKRVLFFPPRWWPCHPSPVLGKCDKPNLFSCENFFSFLVRNIFFLQTDKCRCSQREGNLIIQIFSVVRIFFLFSCEKYIFSLTDKMQALAGGKCNNPNLFSCEKYIFSLTDKCR